MKLRIIIVSKLGRKMIMLISGEVRNFKEDLIEVENEDSRDR